jgi:hypothetical protein
VARREHEQPRRGAHAEHRAQRGTTAEHHVAAGAVLDTPSHAALVDADVRSARTTQERGEDRERDRHERGEGERAGVIPDGAGLEDRDADRGDERERAEPEQRVARGAALGALHRQASLDEGAVRDGCGAIGHRALGAGRLRRHHSEIRRAAQAARASGRG